MKPNVHPSILLLFLLTLPLVWATSTSAHSTRSSLNSTSGIQSSLFAKNTNKAKPGKGSNPTGSGIQPGKGSNPNGNGIPSGKGSNSTGNGIPAGVGSSNNSNKGYKAGGSTPTGNGIPSGKGSNSTGNGIPAGKGSNPTGNGIPPGKGSNSTGNTVQAGPGVGSNNDKKEKPPKKPPTNNNNTGYKTGDNPAPLGPCSSFNELTGTACDPSLPPVGDTNPSPEGLKNQLPEIPKKQ